MKILTTTLSDVFAHRPSPPPDPTPADDFEDLPAIERSGEVIRFQVLRLERDLSPAGILREWIRVIVRSAVVMAVPVLVLLPVLTFALRGIARGSEFLKSGALNALVIVPAVLVLILLIKIFIRMLLRR